MGTSESQRPLLAPHARPSQRISAYRRLPSHVYAEQKAPAVLKNEIFIYAFQLFTLGGFKPRAKTLPRSCGKPVKLLVYILKPSNKLHKVSGCTEPSQILYKTPESVKRTTGVRNYSHEYWYKGTSFEGFMPPVSPGEERWDIAVVDTNTA